MRARAGFVALAAAALALVAGCGGSAKTFRIGMLADCYGAFSDVHDVLVASAEMPLLDRGARLRGKNPSDGLDGGEAAGRTLEVLSGCVTGNDDVIPEARRLVEEEGADVLVGPLFPEQGMVLRAYARRRPDTTFLIQSSDAPELTLNQPAANVFRFFPDSAQWAAGLGAYAYRTLGWRTAVTVGDDVPYGWGAVSGFVAEFCALGGKVRREWLAPFTLDPATLVPKLKGADGVFLGTALEPTHDFLVAYSKLNPDLSRRVVSSGNLLTDPSVLPLAKGIVLGGQLPDKPTPAVARYLSRFTKAFPEIPPPVALNSLALAYRDGVEAALRGLERSDGDGGLALQRALADVRLDDSPEGPIRLDARRQAIAPNFLSRVVIGADGKPSVRMLRIVPNVEQTFGGYFTPQSPPRTRTSPACHKATPPPWAR
jgi:branched-chain amino acid transport system substrate-binding protein